jgi:hypothetical protein
MSSKNSSVQSSSSNLSIVSSEKYWDIKNENNKEINEQYIKYPLKTWNEIVYKYKNQAKKFSKINEGNMYKETVNLILKKDVFKGENFLEENNNYHIIAEDKNINEFLTKEFLKILKTNLQENKDSFIYPDFLVFDIKKDKFLEIIKKRNYMMNFNWNIPEEVETINILGEIKISKKASHLKVINQLNKYQLFVKNYKKKYFVLMYVYDTSYVSFFSNKTKNSESTVPQIISYIPKTYLDDCYKQYNIINGLLYGKTIEWKITDEDIKEKINELNKKLDEKKDKLKELKEKKEYLKKEKNINILLRENFVKLKDIYVNDKNSFNNKKKNLEIKIKDFEKKKLDEDLKKEEEKLDKKEEKLEKEEEDLKNEITNLENELKNLN